MKFIEKDSFYGRKVLKALFVALLFIVCCNVYSQTWNEISKIVDVSGLSFGSSFDVDGNYAVIGDCAYNLYTGRAYVYKKETSGWRKVATLTSSDAKSYDWFGFSVSISGDNIVIGAIQNGYGGAAYIYTKPEAEWVDATETAKLASLNLSQNADFGWSVDITRDTIVVGSINDNGKGSVYVYIKPENGWLEATEVAKLTASDGISDARFGRIVSISENTIVVGASNSTGIGGCYIFEKPENGWQNATQTAKLSSSDITDTDFFGTSVCIFMNTVIVGADNNNKKGAAYIFEKPENGWINMTQTAKLTATDMADFDSFGGSVSLIQDMVIVGSCYNNSKGAAYIFEKPVGGWVDMSQTAKLVASDGSNGNHFGLSVNFSGNCAMVGDNANCTVYFFSKEASNHDITSELPDIKFYPNPANDFITLNTNGSSATIEIFNLQGVLVLKSELIENKNVISVNGLTSGIYIAKIRERTNLYSRKLIINK